MIVGPEHVHIESKDGSESIFETTAEKKISIGLYDYADPLVSAWGKPTLWRVNAKVIPLAPGDFDAGTDRSRDTTKAQVTVMNGAVTESEENGTRHFNWERVFNEHNGVGVNFTQIEIFAKAGETNCESKNSIQFRLEPGQTINRPANMNLWGPDVKSRVVGKARFSGKDDHGNAIEIYSEFTL